MLSTVTQADIDQSKVLAGEGLCEVELVEGVANLYIRLEAFCGDDTVVVEIVDKHTNIVRISKTVKIFWIKNTYWTGEMQTAKEIL